VHCLVASNCRRQGQSSRNRPFNRVTFRARRLGSCSIVHVQSYFGTLFRTIFLYLSVAMPTTCGTLSVGSWPNNRIDEDTVVEVKFGFVFDVRPSVAVQLAGMDAAVEKGKRIHIWASDETLHGFRLHVRSWEDSVTWGVKVSWVATSEPAVVQLGSHTVGGWPHGRLSNDERSEVDFIRPFACAPDVSVAIAAFDAQGDKNLRLWSQGCEVSSRRFSIKCGSWESSVTWGTKISWVASTCPAVLQCGSLAIGSWPHNSLKGGIDRWEDVCFQKAFDDAPSVAVGLMGLDADSSAPMRIDTWVDKVTKNGFRLHAKSWEDSLTWHVKVSWVATPVVPTVTISSIPPHQPPIEYVVEGPPLGEGWWGVIHRAKSPADGSFCAVKTCRHSFSQHEQLLRQELQNLERLPSHHNLIRYHASIIRVDQLHIVTEFVDGFNIADLVPGPDGKYPLRHLPSTILRWMAQLCDGLAHLHKIGMVHRDLHGGNILIEKGIDGKPGQHPRAVRIIDFGLAKVYDEMRPRHMSQQAGFWQYFSPERRRGDKFDCRDDIWATGCHLTELVTGRTISRRPGCGVDGVDFAISPCQVQKALDDCDRSRCGQVARAMLVMDLVRRPSAVAVRDMIHGMLAFMPGKRSAGPSGGGRTYGPISP